jgi:hypothetical protein
MDFHEVQQPQANPEGRQRCRPFLSGRFIDPEAPAAKVGNRRQSIAAWMSILLSGRRGEWRVLPAVRGDE